MIETLTLLKIKKTKGQISNAVTAQLISDIVFATLVVQSLLVLNPKCHASTKPSSVVEQAVLCRTGRNPKGFPSFLSFVRSFFRSFFSFFISFFLSFLPSFFLSFLLGS